MPTQEQLEHWFTYHHKDDPKIHAAYKAIAEGERDCVGQIAKVIDDNGWLEDEGR